MSEELENSLLKAIETHLNERFSAISEELARLQTDFNDTFGRLRESATTGELDSTPLGSAISAHLQAAREQKLSGVTPQPPAPQDLSQLKSAIEDIRNQRTQSDVLNALIRNAAQFADRAVLFVVKGDQAIAWHKAEATSRHDLQAVSGVALPLAGSSVVSQSARTVATETSSATRVEDDSLLDQLDGEPQQLAAVPLVVRRKVVAVLYADSAWPHPDAIQLDALEVLTQVAAIAVELVSGARGAQPHMSAPAPAREVESAPATVEAVQPPVEESTYTPHVEPATAEVEPEREHVEIAAEPVEEVAEAPAMEAPAVETAAVETEAAPEPEHVAEPTVETAPTMEAEAAVEAAPVEEPPAETPAPVEPPRMESPQAEAPAPAEPASQPVFTAQYSTPLGSTRRWGSRDAELPVEVNDEERPLHNDARRFARLLVSEIKLYNEQKVSEGRNQGDIYDRLREDIDRSRQMYDKRVAPPVAARHDYFHQELVNTLAEGDPAKLGNAYPGAAVSVA